MTWSSLGFSYPGNGPVKSRQGRGRGQTGNGESLPGLVTLLKSLLVHGVGRIVELCHCPLSSGVYPVFGDSHRFTVVPLEHWSPEWGVQNGPVECVKEILEYYLYLLV